MKTKTIMLAWTVLSMGLASCGSVCESDVAKETCNMANKSRRPNVVFILADDLGWGEVGAYGQEKIRTPHIDQLAAEGMRFTQNYAGAPVCAPSRNVLLTGKHLGHVTIRGNKPAKDASGEIVEGQFPIPDEAYTIAEAFRDAGYVTGAMGKWGLGSVASTGDPNKQGFDHFFGYNCQRVAHSYYPPHLWSDQQKIIINANPIPGHAKQPEGEVKIEDWYASAYSPELVLKDALQFIDDHKEQPFFLYLPFVEPHVAMHPPKDIVESYPESWDSKPYRGQRGYVPHPRPRAGYAAMITDLDRHVGAVMTKLQELGLDDNTLVVFTSDNGTTHSVGGVDPKFFNSTMGLRGYKGSVYEGGIRVPMIVRWPDHVSPGSVTDQPTYAADQFPTLCEAVGIEMPQKLDGVSLLPVLTGETTRMPRNPMVWTFAGYGGQVAVRMGDWKLLHRNVSQRNKSKDGSWELYHLGQDRNETKNVASDYPEVVASGVALLKRETDENEQFPMRIPDLNEPE